jgi:hypothetical protein
MTVPTWFRRADSKLFYFVSSIEAFTQASQVLRQLIDLPFKLQAIVASL